MMDVIQPRDQAQRNAILPIVRATGEHNRRVMESAHTQLHAALDSMRAELAPHLDAGQRARLDDFARMALPPMMGPPPGRPFGHGPPRFDGHRPPPPGSFDRPPPPGDGPPPGEAMPPPP
jgi:hypothetical protein